MTEANEKSPDWQPVPGSTAHLAVCLHTADLTCCNSYLFRLSSCFVVLDPGGTLEHLDEVCRVLLAAGASAERPVLVLLTHCHRDHSRALIWMKQRLPVPCYYVSEHTGAHALRHGDADVTASFVYGEEGIRAEMDAGLLDEAAAGIMPDWPFCRIGPVQDTVYGGVPVKSQFLQFGAEERVTVFHSPGHSDDSLCLLVGRWLFCGDILFAHKPVVAGLPGWSAQALLKSLAFLDRLLEQGSVDAIWSGHGKVLDISSARNIIATVARETGKMGTLVRLDGERIRFLKECAVVFMQEVGMQLVAQGGRLMRLAEGLSGLGEEGLADALRRDVDMDAIDRYLEEFHQFASGRADDAVQAVIPMKGVELIRKIRKILEAAPLPDGVGALYLTRLEFLLNDYVALMLGMDLRHCVRPIPLIPELRTMLQVLQPVSLTHDELAILAEDEKAFGLYLAQRLDGSARRSSVTVETTEDEERLSVLVEPTRLAVLLGDVLELAMSGEPRRITVRLQQAAQWRGLRIETQPAHTLSPQKLHFYDLFMRLSGGTFSAKHEGVLEVCFPAADADSISSANPVAQQ